MTLFHTLVGVTLIKILSGSLLAQTSEIAATYTPKPVRTTAIEYLVTLPPGYERSNKKWPMIVFLHGGSGRGNDVNLVKSYGPAVKAERDPSLGFVVLSPQCPKGEIWTDAESLIQLVTMVTKRYRIDHSRIYLTGMSMGGRGTWYLAYRFPGEFAAIAPLASFQTIVDTWPARLRIVPVWAFHGIQDSVAPLQDDQEMVEAIRAAGGDAKLSIVPNRGHDLTDIYQEDKLYEWFLTHRTATHR